MSNGTVSSEGGIISGMMGVMMIAIMAPIMISCMGGVTPTPTPTPTPTTYPCPYCDEVFSTYDELVAHYELEHPGEAREPIDIGW